MNRSTRYIVFLTLTYGVFHPLLLAQTQDSVITKYFPTDLTRSMILNDEAEYKEVKSKAYFKAEYTPQGDLIRVEYVPAGWDRPNRKSPRGSTSGLELYYGHWNDWKRQLTEGLTKDDLEGRKYYKALFNKEGRIKDVTFFNRDHVRMWTYHLKWNREGTRSEYAVEFHVHRSLTDFDEHLFAPDLSEMRPGWKARFQSLEDGRPATVEVADTHGNIYYYYTYLYQLEGDSTNYYTIIRPRYYRADSSLVGHHRLLLKMGTTLERVDYFDPQNSLLRTIEYQYDRGRDERIRTVRDPRGEILERRILPYRQ